MSAMLESFDMQVLEYTQSNDIDIQMHPTSDSWAHDETQMEEDGPLHRLSSPQHNRADNSLTMKTDSLAKDASDVAIEIDMLDDAGDAHVEYEMLDAVDHFEADPDILDVEVFDASHAHTPTFNTAILEESKPLGVLTPQPEATPLPTLSPRPAEPLSLGASFPQTTPSAPAEPFAAENHSIVDNPPAGLAASTSGGLPDTAPETAEHTAHPPPEAPQVEPQPAHDGEQLSTHVEDITPVPPSVPDPHTTEGVVAEHATHEPTENDHGHAHWNVEEPVSSAGVANQAHAHEAVDDAPVPASDAQYSVQEHTDSSHDIPPGYDELPQEAENPHAPSATSGDPHEISEGVYIDPPPPVLLSLSQDFNLSLFNRPTSVDSQHVADPQAVHVILEQSPTMFYEPLDTVFEALKQEEVIQSLPGFPDCELVLDAVDLGLSLSEDNVNARSISLHDLNMLHDSLGLQGRLRVRLYAGDVRFLSRYQALQEQISRIQSEVQSTGHYISPAVENPDSFQDRSHHQYADEHAEQDTALPGSSSTQQEHEVEQTGQGAVDDGDTAEGTHPPEASDYAGQDEEQYSAEGADQHDEHEPHYQDPEFHSDNADQSEDGTRTLSDHDDADEEAEAANEGNTREQEEPTTANVNVGEDHDRSSYDESEAEEPVHHEVPQDVDNTEEYEEAPEGYDNQQENYEWAEGDQEEEYEESYEHHTTVDEGEGAEDDQEYSGQDDQTHENNAEVQEQEQGESGDQDDDDHNSVTVIVNEQEVQLELPSEPLEFGEEDWNDELDGEGDLDASWDADPEIPLPSVDAAEPDSVSSPSSSKLGGKRNYDQVDIDEEEETWDQGSGVGSPGSKRSRVQ